MRHSRQAENPIFSDQNLVLSKLQNTLHAKCFSLFSVLTIPLHLCFTNRKSSCFLSSARLHQSPIKGRTNVLNFPFSSHLASACWPCFSSWSQIRVFKLLGWEKGAAILRLAFSVQLLSDISIH